MIFAKSSCIIEASKNPKSYIFEWNIEKHDTLNTRSPRSSWQYAKLWYSTGNWIGNQICGRNYCISMIHDKSMIHQFKISMVHGGFTSNSPNTAFFYFFMCVSGLFGPQIWWPIRQWSSNKSAKWTTILRLCALTKSPSLYVRYFCNVSNSELVFVQSVTVQVYSRSTNIGTSRQWLEKALERTSGFWRRKFYHLHVLKPLWRGWEHVRVV